MKIALFHELNYGGALRTVEEYAKRLALKNSVDIYTLRNNLNFEYEGVENVFCYNFNSKGGLNKGIGARIYKDSIELFRLNLIHKKIAKDIDSKNYDYVFVHPSQYTQSPFLLRYLKTPNIYYCQEPLRIVYDNFLSKIDDLPFLKRMYENINRSLRKKIDINNINSAQLIFVNSKFSQNEIKKAYDLDSIVCYLGVNENKFKPTNVKKKYDILFLGQRDLISGYDLLLSVQKMFKKKYVVKILSRKQDGTGISDNDLVLEYNRARIVVALSRNEPFGLYPLEAMSCGVPVVGINEGGFKESIIDGVNGCLAAPDPIDIKNKIEYLMNNKDILLNMGKKARQNVLNKWTWEKSLIRLNILIKNNLF